MEPQDDAGLAADAGRAEAEVAGGEAEVAGGDAEVAGGDVEAAPAEAAAGASSPHVARVVAWGAPAAVERGRRFTIRVGVACSAGCRPDGWRVEVRDHEGEQRETAALGNDPWPGTDALYHAQVALTAPDAEGLYTWGAAVLAKDTLLPGDAALPDDAALPGDAAPPGDAAMGKAARGKAAIGKAATGKAATRDALPTGVAATRDALPTGVAATRDALPTGDGEMDVPAVAHTDGTARFGVRVVSPPACVVTVVAVDAESRNPVAGARVVAHPYRAVTDRRGVAELRVPAGEYRLFVSGRGCEPFRFDGELKADTTIRAELARVRELTDADIWS